MFSRCFRGVFIAALVLTILAWAGASAGETQGTATKGTTMAFKIAKSGTLVVEIEGVGADIATHAWDKSGIELRIEGLSDDMLKDLETSESGNTVRVKLRGACSGCPGAAMTMKMGVERILKQRVPQVKAVVSV